MSEAEAKILGEEDVEGFNGDEKLSVLEEEETARRIFELEDNKKPGDAMSD